MPKYPSKHSFGWKPSLPDQRDHLYAAPYEVLQSLPPVVDLRPGFPEPPYDQGSLGSCVSNAVAGAIEFLQAKEQIQVFMPSRLFIYYNGRLMEGTVNSDSGESVRDGVRSVNGYGFPPELEWPYDISKFAVQPPSQVYADANPKRVLQYQRILQSLSVMLACLASGYPFLFGISAYSSFESQQVEQTGIVPMPSWGDQFLGGHALLACGYDTSKQWFIVRNSWGSYGDNGYLYIPFSYITNPYLTSDLWTIRLVS